MSCPICAKRPAKRFCPAKGDNICAVCCGELREITIDCPADCPHLIAAHRYGAERSGVPPGKVEACYPDVHFAPEFVYERWGTVTGIATAILHFQNKHKDLHDEDVLSAIAALAETYRTLEAGILYDRRPAAALAGELYAGIGEFVQVLRKREAEERGSGPLLTDGGLFRVFVFLLRMGKAETNGRPLSRAFLNYLRARVPTPVAAEKEDSRIIVP